MHGLGLARTEGRHEDSDFVKKEVVGPDLLVIECLLDSAGERVVRLHKGAAVSIAVSVTHNPHGGVSETRLMECADGA